MEIHYIWIDNFGQFKKTGINLSARYFIVLELTEVKRGRKKGRLLIKYNPDYIENFFEKDNIVSVSGIIGKNGAGKSTILNYIKSHLPEGLEANVNSDLLVYSVNTPNETNHYIAIPPNFDLEIDDATRLFAKVNYTDFPDSTHTFRFSTQISEADFIYYSFFVDYTSDQSDWAGLKNISTSVLLNEGRKRIIEESISLDADSNINEYSSDLDYLIGNEIAKAVQFLISDYSKDLPFKRPEYLFISVDRTDQLFFSKLSKDNDDVIELISQLESKNKKETGIDKEINLILIALIINLLITERKYSLGMSFTHDLRFKKNETLRAFIIRFFKGLANVRLNNGGKDITYKRYAELSMSAPDFIEYLEELAETRIINVIDVRENIGLRFNLSEKSDEAFRNLMKLYLAVKGLTPFLSFRWRSLSTGEQSFLSFVSRFYHLKHHEIGNDNLKKNLIILIDEGDAGYHPEWQRKFFKNTIDFLSKLFSNHQLQIIITANAPFLTSDLPKYCINFIEKTPDGDIIVHDKENNRSQTFASNIHTLFSDSFYMDGALIGEFAKNKIDSIIKYLADGNSTEPDIYYKKTIDLIGEPIIRNKLRGMWNEKFGLGEELELLLSRVNEIKEQIQKNSMEGKSNK